MALKNPSDFFDEEKKESIIDKLVERPELKSFSDAFNVYKKNISKFDDLSETLKNIENIQSDIKDFIKKEDLDNAVISYAFLLEETVSKLKDDVKGINEKHLIKIRSNVSGLAEKINNFVEIEAPKYKKSIIESEIKSSNRYEKFKNDIDIVLEDISKYVSDKYQSISENKDTILEIEKSISKQQKDIEEKYESIDSVNKDIILEIKKSISKHQIDIEKRTEKNISSLNETLDKVVGDLEQKINLVSDNKDEIFEDLSKKIVEVKKLKRSVNKDLKLYEDHKNIVENKISDLEVEIVRSKSNLKEQNKEFVKVQKNVKTNFNSIREEFKTVVDKLNLDNLEEKNNELSKKVRYLEEVFAKFNEKEFLSEGLLNIPPETDNSDPLTPLNKEFVTLDQLQNHYRLFLNRIQQQLATFGGGGETQLKYLDDVVGIATNPAAYDGGYLRYVHSLKKFAFSSPSDGDTWIQGVDGPYTMGRVGIGTSLIQSGDYPGNALVVDGNARFTGIVSIGTSSITLDASTGSISAGDVEVVSSGGGAKFTGIITAAGANFDGNVTIGGTLTYEDVKNVDSLGIITAREDVRVGRNFNVTGLSTFTGITTFSDDVYVGGNINVVGDIVYDEVSGRNLNVSGVSTLNNLIVGGISSFTSTSHTKLPSGTTAQRPTSAVVGDIRYNTTTNQFEGYKGSSPSWGALGGGGSGSPGGSNTQIQFNDSGSFQGNSNLTFDGSKLAVGVDLDVDGQTELDGVNVSGVSVFASDAAFYGGVHLGNATSDEVTGSARFNMDLIPSSTGDKDLGSNNPTRRWGTLHVKNIFQAGDGISTFRDNIDANGDIDVAGNAGIGSLNVTGVSTFAGQVYFNNPIQLAQTQWMTLGTNKQIKGDGNSLNIQAFAENDIEIDVNAGGGTSGDIILKTDDTTLLTASGDGSVSIGTNFSVSGITTLAGNIDLGMGGDDDINVNGNFISGLVPKNNDTYDLGTAGKYWKNLYISDTVVTNNITASGVSTIGNVTVGGATTDLIVEGNARVTGILSVGTGTVVIDETTVKTGTSNLHSVGIEIAGINVLGADTPIGTGATIYNSGAAIFTGIVTATSFTGTLNTAAQPNVTSVGTLTGLTVDGAVSIDRTNDEKLVLSGSSNPYIRWKENNTNKAYIQWSSSAGTLYIQNQEDNSLIYVRDNLSFSSDGGSTVHSIITADTSTQSNITTLGTITTGTWEGTDIADDYIASAATWTAKQDALTFGISNTNAVKIDSSAVGDDEYARFTANGLEGRTATELKSDLSLAKGDVGLGNVENTALSTWAGTSNITTIGTLNSLDVNGNVTIGGTLTYEDVTNIDSVGLVTARRGIVVGSGFGIHVASGVITATTFDGNLATTNLTGTITNTQLAGSIANDKLSNNSVSYGGIELALGASDATPAFNLTDATNYPYTSLTGITTTIFGDATPKLGGDLNGNSKSIYGVGVLTATTFDGNLATTNLTGTITNAQLAGSIADGKLASTFLKNVLEDTTPQLGGNLDGNSKDIYGVGIITATSLDIGGDIELSGALVSKTSSNNKITFSGTTQIGFNAGGQQRLTITNGYIKTSSGTRIQIIGSNSGSSRLDLGRSSDFDSSGIEMDHGDLQMRFRINTTDTFNINENGAVSTGIISATTFSGSGASLTSLPAGELTGIVTAARLASNGTADSSTFLRGDGSWAAAAAGWTPDAQENLVAGNGAGACIDADTYNNILIGCNAGAELDSGDNNVFIGHQAGRCFTSGYSNFAGGYKALFGSWTDTDNSGSNNIAIGAHAGKLITGGIQNVILGWCAGFSITTQSNSVFIGRNAGFYRATGEDNFAFGCGALEGGSTATDNWGTGNIAMGHHAGNAVTCGANNIFLGRHAGKDVTTGCENIFLGKCAGCNTTTGCYNIAFGKLALGTGVVTGTGNIALGCQAGNNLTSGLNNVFIGHNAAAAAAITGYNNTALNKSSLVCLTSGHNNFAGGYKAGKCLTTGCYNILLGVESGGNATLTGNYNISFGHLAGKKITSGSSNVFLGKYTGCSIDTATHNVFLGTEAGKGFTAGSQNVVIGREAGKSQSTGNFNVYLGSSAAYAATGGANNIIAGHSAGNTNGGNYNIMFGRNAGCENTSGSNNVFLGHEAAKGVTTGSCNVVIGYGATVSCATGKHQLAIGIGNSSWITGNSDFNVGIGTTNPNVAVTSGNTAKLSVGILSAYQLYGDGSNLTNLPAAGFSPDSQENLYAGTNAGAASDADTCFNIALGCKAGQDLNAGDRNILIGLQAGESLTTGGNNIYMGAFAGGDKTTGDYNIALGLSAGKANEGSCNVFAGKYAGRDNTTGNYNVFLGLDAGKTVTTGEDNIALGQLALGTGVVTGSNNIALGKCSAASLTSSQYTTIVGAFAGKLLTNVADNTLIGASAGMCLIGQANSVLGKNALGNMCHSNYNVAVGSGALYGSSTYTNNTAGCNVAIGLDAGNCVSSGGFNILIGRDAGKTVSTGSDNIAMGQLALGAGTVTGSYNVAFGYQSGCALTSGATHILIGKYAGKGLGGSQDNIFMGKYSGCATSGGSYNVAIGANTMIGTGNKTGNTSLGRFAGCAITAAKYNTFLGYGAGHHTTTGCYNIAIGCAVCLSANDANTELAIGCGTSRWICGDSSFNVTLAGIATISSATGIVSATKFCGDGSALTGISAGFSPDSQENLYAGTSAGAASDADTCYNIGIGYSAGKALNEGDNNILLGCKAGTTITDGAYNVAIGAGAGQNIGHCSGCDANVYIGRLTGACNRGSKNVALGCCAMRGSNTVDDNSGYRNVVLGMDAAKWLTSGSQNVIIGESAGCGCCLSGNYNVLLGSRAGEHLTSGCMNTFIGYDVGGDGIITGNKNVVMGGWMSGYKLTSGSQNILIGNCAGKCLTTGSNNIALGIDALGIAEVTGDYNIAFGVNSGKAVTSGNRNIILGQNAGCSLTSNNDNIVIGKNAASSMSGDGAQNVFLGMEAGCTQTTTCWSVAIGQGARLPITDGCRQLSIGCYSKSWIVGDCDFNVGIGTTIPTAAVGAGNTAVLAVGIVSAYQLYGDGSNLTGISGGGSGGCLKLDADVNLYSDGTCSGCDLDGSSACFNILLGGCAGKAIESGSNNIFLGKCVGKSLVSGNKNIALGFNAMKGGVTTGDLNIAIGSEAGCLLTSGANNIFLGQCAGRDVTTGNRNIAIGWRSFSDGTTTGDNNIFLGEYSGNGVTSGGDNIFLGESAGRCIATGSQNIGMGRDSMSIGPTTGNQNIAFGCRAGCKITSGGDNIAFGQLAMGSGTVTGSNNIAFGKGAGCTLTSGSNNIFLGKYAGDATTSGNYNVAIGAGVDLASATGSSQLAIGCGTSYWITGDSSWNIKPGAGILDHTSNVGTAGSVLASTGSGVCWVAQSGGGSGGFEADADDNLFASNTCSGCNLDGSSGCDNIFLGECTGKSTTSGKSNIFMGLNAGCANVNGHYNVFFGQYAGKSHVCNQGGTGNVYIGKNAGAASTNTYNNVFIGPNAGAASVVSSFDHGEGHYNVYIGSNAGCSVNANWNSRNVFIGQDAGCSAAAGCSVIIGSTIGKNADGGSNVLIGRCVAIDSNYSAHANVFIGYYTGQNNTTGAYNVFFGKKAGRCNTSGSNNTIIGDGAASAGTVTGSQNTIVGSHAGKDLTSGARNIFLGRCAAENVNTGADNVVAGWLAGKELTSQNYNVLLGYRSGNAMTGHSNIALGSDSALFMQGGNYSIAIGYYALRGEENDSNGGCNIGIGCHTGNDLTDGDNNLFIGNAVGCTVTTGCCNVIIGHKHQAVSNTGNTQFSIGVGSTSWIRGDSSFNIYDKDGNQLNGGGGGSSGVSAGKAIAMAMVFG